MAEYCTQQDLEDVRPGVTTVYSLDSIDDRIVEAGLHVDRAIVSRWYRRVCDDLNYDWRETPFSRDQLPDGGSQLTDLAVYKTLEIIFFKLSKVGNQDNFAKESEMFGRRYEKELSEVVLYGINYDWDDDDSISDSETNVTTLRRIVRG